jgi:hypothetical protein
MLKGVNNGKAFEIQGFIDKMKMQKGSVCDTEPFNLLTSRKSQKKHPPDKYVP